MQLLSPRLTASSPPSKGREDNEAGACLRQQPRPLTKLLRPTSQD